MTTDIKPMLAKLIKEPFDSPEWLFEVKWDGYRALAFLQKGKVQLKSRNNLSFNTLFSPIVDELSKICHDAILDGEIVLLDKKGKSNFQYMQNYQRAKQGDLHYYVFDLLFLDGKDLRELPLIERKKRLKKLLNSVKLTTIRYSDHVETHGKAFFMEASKHNLEGIMGKKIDSPYRSTRSSDWVKIKVHQRQEFVIGGFTQPQGSRKNFGALLIGVYDKKELIYVGHVGGGFNTKLLSEIYETMIPLKQEKSPFKNAPKESASITWIKPKLVCEVSFQEWTSENILRQPIFQGLRLDKKATEVKMEKPETIQESENKLTNLDKIYWPKEKYTKGDLISYYKEIAPYILPYLKDRPVMLKRYPEGISKEPFYQKDASSLHLPKEIETFAIKHEKKTVHYLLIQNLSSLEYVINLGTIELHAFNSRIQHLKNPDYLVFDLDPLNISFDYVIETAQALHDMLESIKVTSYCKTSGKRGLHIYVPLGGLYTYEQGRQFGQIIADIIHKQLPEFTSLERKPSNREKKVYIDLLQNSEMQTIVAPYCVRGQPGAPVATPLTWDEVKKGLDPKDFTIKTIPERLKKVKDLFKPILGKGIDIKKALKRLEMDKGPCPFI